MICNTIGQTADSYQSIYVTGGVEVAEVYGGLNYADPIFYKTQTMTRNTPFLYESYPGVFTDYTILGNSYQNGVPDPDNPVEVVSVGDLVTSGGHAGEYVIPVTVSDGTNSQTYPIYLSEPLRRIGEYADEIDFKAGTVTRKIYELILNGREDFVMDPDSMRFYFPVQNMITSALRTRTMFCTNFLCIADGRDWRLVPDGCFYNGGTHAVPGRPHQTFIYFRCDKYEGDLNGFKNFISAQYQAGTPVKIYYPLFDSLVPTEQITLPTIPTINGQNALTVDTTVQPSSVSITGHIKPVTS